MDIACPPRPWERRSILGMYVHATSYADAVRRVRNWALTRQSRYVCEAPVHMVMESYDSPEYRQVINGADLVTPGGMPIVWLMRILGVRKQPRVYGPQLMLHLCEDAAQTGLTVGLYGGTLSALEALISELKRRYPALDIRYAYSPPFRPLTTEEDRKICSEIERSGVQILFVGLGCPKQERWMAEHRPRLPVVMLGVGAAFDFISGKKPWAPALLQRLGLEWLFRLATEPGRLGFRYLWHNPRFVCLVVLQVLQRSQFSAKPMSRRRRNT
jgi:N-acetylglucosaminyldiphosphoundecaprenol N-acetyl-beta-D-mannosaminyltransferase